MKILLIGILFGVLLLLSTYLNPFFIAQSVAGVSPAEKRQKISLTALLVEPRDRWDLLIPEAIKLLQQRHPDMDVNINYTVLPYGDGSVRRVMEESLEKKLPVDIISVDQIWLADFAQKGLISDLDNRTKNWGRLSDWYQSNLDGMVYGGKTYGIWAWTDERMVWYWKDLMQQANVNPESLKTWDGFIAATKKLNDLLKDQGIQGVQLICGGAEWYPYLWMQGGNILKVKNGHPTKSLYWFPTFNGTEGIRASEFLRNITKLGIVPQTQNFENNFANKKFAIYIGGSWIPGSFPNDTVKEFEQKIGMNPGYPVPSKNNATTTIMGGWELSIPETSRNKDLAWELITIMTSPDVLTSMLKQTGYLPTQISIGEGQYAPAMNGSIPYYNDMIPILLVAKSRPVIPEFPEIDQFVTQSLLQICNGTKEPAQALNDAAAKSAKLLGW
jgi:multiple sugar transport system substrate-binding protein